MPTSWQRQTKETIKNYAVQVALALVSLALVYFGVSVGAVSDEFLCLDIMNGGESFGGDLC